MFFLQTFLYESSEHHELSLTRLTCYPTYTHTVSALQKTSKPAQSLPHIQDEIRCTTKQYE